MKKSMLTVALVAISTVAALAQKVTESAVAMSQGTNNAFSVKLPGTDKKEVEKAWQKYVKEYGGKQKFDKKADESQVNNATIKKINGDNTIDIYAKVTADSKIDNTLTVWYNLGGAYLSSQMHGEKVKEAQTMLSEFAMNVSRTMIEEQLKEEEKKLKKEDTKLKDLEKDKKGLEGDIESCKKKIAKAEADIKENEAKQKEQSGILATQKAAVEEVKKRLESLK